MFEFGDDWLDTDGPLFPISEPGDCGEQYLYLGDGVWVLQSLPLAANAREVSSDHPYQHSTDEL